MDEALAPCLDHFDLFSSAQDDLATAIFAEFVPCPFDSEGRIGVPAHLLTYAGIDEAATFVGLGRKFQIWTSAAFEKRRDAARNNVVRDGLTLPRLGKGDAS